MGSSALGPMGPMGPWAYNINSKSGTKWAHNDFDDLDFGQAGLVYIYSLFFLILVVLMIVLAVVVVVVEAVVFTKMFPERFYLRPVQEHFCKCLVGFWTKCSFR